MQFHLYYKGFRLGIVLLDQSGQSFISFGLREEIKAYINDKNTAAVRRFNNNLLEL